MAEFPKEFPLQGDVNIASFSWQDIQAGLGYERFYLVGTNATGTVNNVTRLLTPNNVETVQQNFNTIGFATTVTVETSAFNLPRTLRGKAYVGFYGYAMNSTSKTYNVTIQYHDGTSWSDISSQSNCSLTWSSYGRFAYAIDLTKTLVRKGDKLRVEVVIPSGVYLTGNTASYPAFVDLPFEIDN